MAARDQKSEDKETLEKITVLKRPGGRWEDREITQLACNFRVAIERHPSHPAFLIIRAEFDPKRVQTALGGKSNFQHQVIAVSDSKKLLPFEIMPR